MKHTTLKTQRCGPRIFRKTMSRWALAHGFSKEPDASAFRLMGFPTEPSAQATANRRSGVALLVVLVALGIVSSIGMTLLRMSLMHHRQAQRSAFAAQSRWLAESAFDQAGRRLKADAKLAGFTWSVPVEELDGRHAAQVTIEVKPVENAPQRRAVTVIADYPATASQRVRTRCERLVDL